MEVLGPNQPLSDLLDRQIDKGRSSFLTGLLTPVVGNHELLDLRDLFA
jgi:hypothetical protein